MERQTANSERPSKYRGAGAVQYRVLIQWQWQWQRRGRGRGRVERGELALTETAETASSPHYRDLMAARLPDTPRNEERCAVAPHTLLQGASPEHQQLLSRYIHIYTGTLRLQSVRQSYSRSRLTLTVSSHPSPPYIQTCLVCSSNSASQALSMHAS